MNRPNRSWWRMPWSAFRFARLGMLRSGSLCAELERTCSDAPNTLSKLMFSSVKTFALISRKPMHFKDEGTVHDDVEQTRPGHRLCTDEEKAASARKAASSVISALSAIAVVAERCRSISRRLPVKGLFVLDLHCLLCYFRRSASSCTVS